MNQISLIGQQFNSLSKEINMLEPHDSNNKNSNSVLIDIDSIAFNFGFNKINEGGPDHESDNLISVQSNEQLVFRSEIDGRSNQNDIKDEIMSKITPSMFR
jgi:hypothetical protein